MPGSKEGFEHLHGISQTPATQPFPDGLSDAEAGDIISEIGFAKFGELMDEAASKSFGAEAVSLGNGRKAPPKKRSR